VISCARIRGPPHGLTKPRSPSCRVHVGIRRPRNHADTVTRRDRHRRDEASAGRGCHKNPLHGLPKGLAHGFYAVSHGSSPLIVAPSTWIHALRSSRSRSSAAESRRFPIRAPSITAQSSAVRLDRRRFAASTAVRGWFRVARARLLWRRRRGFMGSFWHASGLPTSALQLVDKSTCACEYGSFVTPCGAPMGYKPVPRGEWPVLGP
jgi:hypothetical protein